MSVLDAEMAYHEESLNYHLALLRLEESTGVPLMDDDPAAAQIPTPARAEIAR